MRDDNPAMFPAMGHIVQMKVFEVCPVMCDNCPRLFDRKTQLAGIAPALPSRFGDVERIETRATKCYCNFDRDALIAKQLRLCQTLRRRFSRRLLSSVRHQCSPRWQRRFRADD